MKNEDIIAVVSKYKDYFDQWNAGVATGVKGDHVFYVLGDYNGVELFTTFKTAEQLERLILGTLAENAACMLEAAADSLSMQFSQLSMEKEAENRDVTKYIPLLARELSLIREEYRQWSHMIEVTFKALEKLGIDWEQEAKDYSAGE